LSIYAYQKLWTEFNNEIKQVTQSIEALQDLTGRFTHISRAQK
jgi:hypothetical protein